MEASTAVSMLSDTFPPSTVKAVRLPAPRMLTVKSELNWAVEPA